MAWPLGALPVQRLPSKVCTCRRSRTPGARVVVLARRAQRLSDLVARIEKNGGRPLALAVDVADAVAVQSAADQVAAELGGADLLFNNAGVMLFNPAEAPAVGSWQREIDINVKGLANVVVAFTPQLVRAAAEREVADLINTSSVAAQSVLPAFAVYAGTKAYVSHLSRNLRAELGAKEVRVSVIEPGLVDTELQNHVGSDEVRAALKGAKQMLEWLTPQDIAETVGFVASLPPRVNLPHITVMPTGRPA
ncbi:SDR family oxidoreductase [Streptomyces sp. NBC_01483]|uniref:SDR family oxidoreductase n=1 Tax=Streptomyces sp. NBC_01483 TaxID=2903883 RepID=UPI002E336EE9|nr:SDR family oxidoreductase [Streptomyces sp. NBC_01483]